MDMQNYQRKTFFFVKHFFVKHFSSLKWGGIYAYMYIYICMNTSHKAKEIKTNVDKQNFATLFLHSKENSQPSENTICMMETKFTHARTARN